MRLLILAALVAAVSGCSHVFPIATYSHHSDPTVGEPFDHDTLNCDPTSDFLGGGVGYAHKGTRVYVSVGRKMVRQCDLPGTPHVDHSSIGGSLLVIQEFGKDR